jgi:predicted nucleic acid-binding Zn ribbon protein
MIKKRTECVVCKDKIPQEGNKVLFCSDACALKYIRNYKLEHYKRKKEYYDKKLIEWRRKNRKQYLKQKKIEKLRKILREKGIPHEQWSEQLRYTTPGRANFALQRSTTRDN